MDINVGNDIRVNFTLKGIDNEDGNIKYIKCYFINTSATGKNCAKCYNHSFNHEAFPQYYNPTMYTIGNCGEHTYNVLPHYCQDPKKFIRENIITHTYKHNALFEGHTIITDPDKHQVSTYFSGHKQLLLGKYKLVVLLVMEHEDTWKKYQLHEYSFNFGEIFKLVKDGGKDGKIVIDLDDNTPTPPPPPSDPNYLWIGYVPSNCVINDKLDISSVNLDTFTTYNKTSGSGFTYCVPENNMHVVLVSTAKISSVKNDTSGFNIAIKYDGLHYGYNYYHFVNALRKTNPINITIS